MTQRTELIPEAPDNPYRLGRSVNHDERSKAYPAALAPTYKAVWWPHYGPVINQGQIGSCTGNALVDCLMTGPLYRQGRNLSEPDAVRAYERAGAAAVSVLTEETRFGGRLEDLGTARDACSLPVLRKDFIVDSYQVHEALAAGADAVLLIVAALPGDALTEMLELAGKLGLDALVEVHDEAELEGAVGAGASIIGINNRNLATLQVDVETTFRLLPRVPADVVRVAESGFGRRAELERLAAAGVDAVLVGEALMRAPDIEAACRALTGVG